MPIPLIIIYGLFLANFLIGSAKQADPGAKEKYQKIERIKKSNERLEMRKQQERQNEQGFDLGD